MTDGQRSASVHESRQTRLPNTHTQTPHSACTAPKLGIHGILLHGQTCTLGQCQNCALRVRRRRALRACMGIKSNLCEPVQCSPERFSRQVVACVLATPGCCCWLLRFGCGTLSILTLVRTCVRVCGELRASDLIARTHTHTHHFTNTRNSVGAGQECKSRAFEFRLNRSTIMCALGTWASECVYVCVYVCVCNV